MNPGTPGAPTSFPVDTLCDPERTKPEHTEIAASNPLESAQLIFAVLNRNRLFVGIMAAGSILDGP